EQQNCDGQVTYIHRRIDVGADKAVLRQGQQSCDALLIEEPEQFVQLHGEELFAGHGIEQTVEAVDDQQLQILLIDHLSYLVHKLARREFGGIDLSEGQCFAFDMFADVEFQ